MSSIEERRVGGNSNNPRSSPTVFIDVIVRGEDKPLRGDEKPRLDAASSPQFAKLGCFSIRYLSLFLLVGQNCVAVLMMRYTQTRPNVERYNVTTLIVMTEIVKILFCVLVLAFQQGVRGLMADVVRRDAWLLLIPAACYTIQNKLLFLALANLEATLFQVTYQFRVVVTAVFMTMMLGRKFSVLNWVALALLFAGIVLTQLKAGSISKIGATGSLTVGLIAVFVCAVTSAFASVYFEKLLKNYPLGILPRNVQLGVFCAIMAFAVMYVEGSVAMGDFFKGYDTAVWLLVANQAFGGLLVAIVIKYADNVLKGFSTSVAIIVSGIISYMYLDFVPNLLFLAGASLVVFAIGLYAIPS